MPNRKADQNHEPVSTPTQTKDEGWGASYLLCLAGAALAGFVIYMIASDVLEEGRLIQVLAAEKAA